MKKILMLLGLVSISSLAACSNANMAKYNAWGQPHHVKQFSGSVLIGEWNSTGKVENDGENGYSFQDKETGLNVRISGHVTITVN